MKRLVTGSMQEGKSTFAREVVSRLSCRILGIYTQLEREEKEPRRVWLRTSLGAEAECITFSGESGADDRIREAVVHDDVFNVWLPSQCASRISPFYLIIDELGIMEQHCPLFVAFVQQLLCESEHALIVVQERALEFWRDQLQCLYTDEQVFYRADAPALISSSICV
ncbi:MAG: hypothetical protein EOL87_04205 [Spartobacteria bacterium]|nr:hypothetical protein [Spartobacteria bacterium]